ncbi:type I phosphomannose isomerase catalytic subunit [Chakrabartyella piscis]|uniref:type I phosphomannose isomerase catalytic subunit n=1 Tax=Chakrabartyella piscis TaxID=2918914 RepID=UPI0029584226|nr:type I phosphomannose isomerase catalytic subunit [Chakrabartyella piscis]
MNLLKLKPACKDYIWGGKNLVSKFHKETAGSVLAETWELSTHPDGSSIIDNGELKGNSFREYITKNKQEVLGTNCEKFNDFPILIKLIDAEDNLSIQVHPDDDYALKYENQYGKTEVWYIVDCEKDSYIYFGLAKEIGKDEFQERIQNNTLLEVLNKVPVKKGDVFFIEAGTIHAICKGIVIAEIQQNSNVTYRVYDYDRRDSAGNTRELHIEKAVDVTNLKPTMQPNCTQNHLSQCDYFTVDQIHIEKPYTQEITSDTFVHVLVLDGNGTISTEEETLSYKKGDSFFLPAKKIGETQNRSFALSGKGTALLTTVA